LETPLDFHARAASIIRRGDYLEWQQFVRQTRRKCEEQLLQFRLDREENDRKTLNSDDPGEMVIEAASLFSPLMAIALAGVESGSERFRNQTSVLSDILNPSGWIRSGRTDLTDLPEALAFIYQAVNGAMCVQSRQFDLAATLAKSRLLTGVLWRGRPTL
jgi:hypothetical protein